MKRVRPMLFSAVVFALGACANNPTSTNQPTSDTPTDQPAKDSSNESTAPKPDTKPEPKPDNNPQPTPAASSDAVLASLVGTWRLVSLNGHDISPRLASLPKPPTITFAADAGLSGFAGVNRFTGRLDRSALADGVFKTSPLAMTRMAGPPDAMQLEGEFATALSKSTAYKLDANTLQLLAGGSLLAAFERAK